jgi:phosphatidylserine synthase
MRLSVGPFGVKDLFTLFNLVSGVAAVWFVLHGRLDEAGYAVIVGYLFGDTLDGAVARATKTSNRFGSELDTVTDHFVHGIVPGMILMQVYERGGHATLGVVLFAVLVTGATVRHALFAVAKFDYPLCWCGLPRTIAGFATMAFALSTLFRGTEYGYAAGAVIVPLLAAMGIAPIPYMTHRGKRRAQGYVRLAIFLFFATTPAAFFFARAFTFDVFFFWTFAYAFVGWIPVHPDERRAFYAEYRRWAAAAAG